MTSIAVPEARPAAVPTSARSDVDRAALAAARTRLLLLAAFGASAAYLLWHLDRGWLSYDDGVLGETAVRRLHGELAYRDFDGIYTGGLDYLYGWAFQLFGTSLLVIRLVLFACTMLWLPTVYYLISRFVRPFAAGTITLLALVWTVPNYPAGMPSWYNLFLATAGAAALFRYLETRRARWLVLAGAAGGCSFLIKVIGLYFVAAALLFFIYLAHATARRDGDADDAPPVAYAAFVSVALLIFVGVLCGLVKHQLHAAEVVQFVLPGALIAGMLAQREWTQPAGGSAARFAGLARLVGPFLLGLVLPVVVFLIPYARSGALGSFAYGVFLLPMKRFGFADARPLPLGSALTLLPLGLTVLVARRWRAPLSGWRAAVAVAPFAVLLVAASTDERVYRGVWYAAGNLIPCMAAVAVLVVARSRASGAAADLLRARTMALLCVMAICTLVQFPFSAPIYLCYALPFALFLGVALHQFIDSSDRVLPGAFVGFCLAFGIADVNGRTLGALARRLEPYPMTVPLGLPRSGVRVQARDAQELHTIIPALQQHARGGYTWAAPDAPEIYFLSGLRNPTRTLFDFFDDDTNRTSRTLDMLDRYHITAIVLNAEPSFSRPITLELYRQLQTRFPHAVQVGRLQLRWRS